MAIKKVPVSSMNWTHNMNMVIYSTSTNSKLLMKFDINVLVGHLNCKVVDFLKENKLIFNKIKNYESICKNCDSSYAAKFCRLPFLLVDSNCDYQLARIHCDLWGLTTKVNERRIGPKGIKWPKWTELDQNKWSRPK